PDLGVDSEAADNFLGLLEAPDPPPAPPPPNQWAVPLAAPGVYDTLRLLAELGVLQRLLPEIGEAYRRVPFDQVHPHTIGFHSLEAGRSLEALRSRTDERLQEFRRIWADVEAPERLLLAPLLHDGRKISTRSGHSE